MILLTALIVQYSVVYFVGMLMESLFLSFWRCLLDFVLLRASQTWNSWTAE